MLIAAGGLLSGYNGSFAFEKPGDLYPETVPYTTMRIVSYFEVAPMSVRY